MTVLTERVVSPLDFGSDFNPLTPEGHVPPGLQMRRDLEARNRVVALRVAQIKSLRKSASALDIVIKKCQDRGAAADQAIIALAEFAKEDKARLLQSAFLVIADGIENDSLPAYFQVLTNRTVIESVVENHYPFLQNDPHGKIALLSACNITNVQELLNTHEALLPLLWKRTEKEQHVRDIQIGTLKCRQKFFYEEYETPKALGERMVRAAQILPGQRVLEPSAGIGALAEVILALKPATDLCVIEKNPEFRQLLTLRGFNVSPETDFLLAEVTEIYDRIIMSPPWSQGMDMEHVIKAAKHLAPGGRLVALVTRRSFEDRDSKGRKYREWVSETNTDVVPLNEDEFKKVRGTGGVLLFHTRNE